MVSLIKRMNRLRTLLDIRIGPGAAVISSDVKRIHLNFAKKINDGHMGPRKFWHHYLPRLKYYNPAIPITIERTADQEGPASLTIFFAAPNTSTPAAPTQSTSGDKVTSKDTAPLESTKSINMKHRSENEILEELLRLTDGKPILATAEEEQQAKELEELRKRSEADRLRQAAVVAQKKRQADILAAARQSVGDVAGTA